MNMRRGSLALLLLLAGCASTPIGGAERRTVVVEGWAPARGRASGAKALGDAQKRAVEKAFGVKLAASTRIDAAIAVRSRIWAVARGRVEKWTVLKDGVVDGFRRMRIRAVVRRVADDEELPPPPDTTVRIVAPGPAEAGLRRGFTSKGFILVERGGDFVVKGYGDSSPLQDARTAPFVSARGAVNVSVVEARTGGVVWERSSEAGGLDTDLLAATIRAVESAGEQGGRDAADGLSRILWNR